MIQSMQKRGKMYHNQNGLGNQQEALNHEELLTSSLRSNERLIKENEELTLIRNKYMEIVKLILPKSKLVKLPLVRKKILKIINRIDKNESKD